LESLIDNEWRRLTSAIARGKCIAFVGQDAVIPDDEKAGRSLWGLLTQEILESLGQEELERDLDFFAAAERHDLIREDRFELEDCVSQFFSQYSISDVISHRQLAKLPFPLYVHTGTDNLLYQAVRKEKPGSRFSFYNYISEERTQNIAPTVDAPLVYNIYGYLSKSSSAAVLTERDLLDFISAIMRKSPPLPSAVSRLFNDPEMSFLFLGVRFHQWYGRILLQMLRETNRKYRSIALEKEGFFRHPDQSAVAFFCNKAQKIEFKRIDPVEVLNELCERVTEEQKVPVVDVPANAPKVFISYASEDETLAASLAQEFQSAQIQPWIDKQELRGGDNWERQLHQVIDKHVDYFVFLHTRNMHKRDEGVFWAESDTALARQRRLRPGVRFYIPVAADDSELPVDL